MTPPAAPSIPPRRRVTVLLWLALAVLTGAMAVAVIPACGVVLPWNGRAIGFCDPPAPSPVSAPPELAALALHQRLLEEELHRVRLRLVQAPDCPEPMPEQAAIEPLPDPEPVAPIPPPPPRPPRQALPPQPDPPPGPPTPADDRLRIPDDVDETGDLEFLAGCWRTDPFRHRPTQSSPGISTYCFDSNGQGSLTFRRDGLLCEAPARVEILPGRGLRIWDADTRCNDGSAWFQDRLDCTTADNGVARCSGESSFDNRWTVNLHRA